MRFITCITVTLLIFIDLQGQTKQAFIPTINDSLFFNAQLQQIEKNYQSSISQLSGDNKKAASEIFKERFSSIKSYFTDKKLYCNNQAESYLKALLYEIIKSNPELQKDSIYLFFNTTEVPNAASVGEKMLIFNTGLFKRLENESQVAFVLSHELAHLLLDHSSKQIIRYVETVNSKEFHDELKKINKTEFQKRAQFEKLTKGLSFDSRKHSRYRESEADSMAIMLLKNTKFNITEATKALAILDSIDADKFDTETVLANVFNTPSYPFKKSWLAKEEGLLGGHANIEKDKKLEDSLKTHPDCSVRIKSINAIITNNTSSSTKSDIIDRTYFLSLQKLIELDNLENYYQHKNYDLALYYSLKALEKDTANVYIITLIGKTLNNIFDAQKGHALSKYTNMPSPANSQSLNSLLQFIQNLYLDEIANINVNFLSRYQSSFVTDSNFTKTLSEANKRKNAL